MSLNGDPAVTLTIWSVCALQIDLIIAQEMPGQTSVFHLAEQLSGLEIVELRARAQV
jgi:hypothetical protein